MISALLLSIVPLLAAPNSGEASAAPLPVSPIWNWRSYDAPRVRVWLEDDRTFHRGQRARVAFRTEDDAYVTVVRIDTDGRMRIIFPERPHYDHRVAGGRIYGVHGPGDGSFRIDDRSGMGYIFAIASWDRFDFERAYDSPFHEVGYRVRGDPYDAVSALAEEMLPYRDAVYATHAAEYYVDSHRDYPRYACNECHYGGTHPGHWHPHIHRCSGIQLVIFGGHHHHHYPDYYPYYYYHGPRRIYVRQHRYRPQYEFKEVRRGERVTSTDNFIERRSRTVAVDTRRPGSPLRDPNIDGRRPGTVAPGAGATKPGGSSGESDGRIGTLPGRRRGHEADGPGNSNNAPGRTGETPRRGNGGASNGGGNSDDAPGRTGETPRRGIGGAVEGAGSDGAPGRTGDSPRRGSAEGAQQERQRGTRVEDGPPRRAEPEIGDRQADPRDGRAWAPREDRRPERSVEPRVETRSDAREESRRAEPRRSEPVREPRRAEPREATRSEPRRAEPRSEPRRESRPAAKSGSTESRSSGAKSRSSGSSSRPSSSTPRRKP